MYNLVMKDLWTYLKEEYKKGRPVVLYGTGDGADKIYARLSSDGMEPAGVFASTGFVRDRYYLGMKVVSFDDIRANFDNPIVLVCFGSSRPEVIHLIDDVRSRAETYAPDVPVCGGEVFDSAFYEQHKEELDKVSEHLSDDLSRTTMKNIVEGRLTGDISRLHAAECTLKDIYDLISLPQDSVFFDLGAYTGDTVKEFTGVFPSIRHIVAIEPEPRNYRKLEELSSVLTDLDFNPLRALISDVCSDSYILPSARGRGTREKKEGIPTKAVTVDSLVMSTGLVPDFIKYDVEGNEIKGILGAKETILDHKPLLKIACYHKSPDIFEIPKAVLAIRPDYKVYMRHLPSIPGWDTDLIFV